MKIVEVYETRDDGTDRVIMTVKLVAKSCKFDGGRFFAKELNDGRELLIKMVIKFFVPLGILWRVKRWKKVDGKMEKKMDYGLYGMNFTSIRRS